MLTCGFSVDHEQMYALDRHPLGRVVVRRSRDRDVKSDAAPIVTRGATALERAASAADGILLVAQNRISTCFVSAGCAATVSPHRCTALWSDHRCRRQAAEAPS
jgi:hypothetical protein